MTEELLNILTIVLILIFAISVLFWARKQVAELKEGRMKFKEEYTEKANQLLNQLEDERIKTDKHKDYKEYSACINKEFE